MHCHGAAIIVAAFSWATQQSVDSGSVDPIRLVDPACLRVADSSTLRQWLYVCFQCCWHLSSLDHLYDRLQLHAHLWSLRTHNITIIHSVHTACWPGHLCAVWTGQDGPNEQSVMFHILSSGTEYNLSSLQHPAGVSITAEIQDKVIYF